MWICKGGDSHECRLKVWHFLVQKCSIIKKAEIFDRTCVYIPSSGGNKNANYSEIQWSQTLITHLTRSEMSSTHTFISYYDTSGGKDAPCMFGYLGKVHEDSVTPSRLLLWTTILCWTHLVSGVMSALSFSLLTLKVGGNIALRERTTKMTTRSWLLLCAVLKPRWWRSWNTFVLLCAVVHLSIVWAKWQEVEVMTTTEKVSLVKSMYSCTYFIFILVLS